MRIYDLYLFDGEAEVVVGWHKLEALNNNAALNLAEKFLRIGAMELWQATELVKRWEAPPTANPTEG